jgi:hypothetical protein
MTLTFDQEYFQHAILIIEDALGGSKTTWIEHHNRLAELEIYIGNSENYLENAKCTGGVI